MHKSVPAVVAAALLAGILSACTVAPTVGTDVESEAEAQTLRQACDLMLPALQSMTAEMTNAFEELSSDPTQASPLLHSIGEDFRAAIDELENDDVIDVMTTAADSLDSMTTAGTDLCIVTPSGRRSSD